MTDLLTALADQAIAVTFGFIAGTMFGAIVAYLNFKKGEQ